MDIIKICKIEAIALIVISMLAQIILETPKFILQNNASGSLLSTLTISIISFIIILIINHTFNKFNNKDILDLSDYAGGKFLKIVTSIGYIIFFFISSLTALYSITEALHIIYFPNASTIYLALFFIVPIVFLIRKGFPTICKVNVVISIISAIFMAILFIKSIPLFVTERLFPLSGYELYKSLFYNISAISAFQGISYIMFLHPLLKDQKDFKKINIISFIIMTIVLLLAILCLLLVSPFVNFVPELLSLYLLTRLIEFGSFLARIDAIYTFFWIFCIMSYLTINMYFILHIFAKNTKLKTASPMSYSLSILLLAGLLLLKKISDYIWLKNIFFYNYFIILMIFSVIILIICNIKKNKINSKENAIRKKR